MQFVVSMICEYFLLILETSKLKVQTAAIDSISETLNKEDRIEMKSHPCIHSFTQSENTATKLGSSLTITHSVHWKYAMVFCF